MNIEQFEDLVDRFGERPADWPDDIREQASKFLAGSRDAQEFVAEASALRNMFHDDVAERAPASRPRAENRASRRVIFIVGMLVAVEELGAVHQRPSEIH